MSLKPRSITVREHMRKNSALVAMYGISVALLVAVLLLPGCLGFIPDRNSGYEPGLVTVSVIEPNKVVEPGSEAIFEAVLRNDNPFAVFIHIEIIPIDNQWSASSNRNDFLLEEGSTETVFITLLAPPTAKNGTEATVLLLINAGQEPEEHDSSNSRLLNAVVLIADENTFIAASMMVTSSLILLSIMGYLGSTEYGKYTTLVAGAPLYSRIHKEKVLEHRTRDDIYSFIKLNPGVNFTKIKDEFELTNGTLLHHLKTLDRERFIKSCRTGLYRRFYPWGMKIQMEKTLVGVQKTIFRFIRKNEGVCQTDIAREMGASRQSINHHVKALEEMKLIRLKKVGRKTGCFLVEQVNV